MRKRDHGLFTNAVSMLVCGLLAGVVVAAALFPALALSGMAAKAGGEAFGQLPELIEVKRSPQLTYVYANNNKTLLATMYDENRRDLPFEDMPKIMRDAIIAAEDKKFYEHNGVDMWGIARALIKNKSAGDVQQGASTITMQYVRIAISYSSDSIEEIVSSTEDTNQRKIREMKYAIALESRMSKDEILEAYLNTVDFGNRAFGIFAAAQVYFKKHPRDLTASESAFIAALPKHPGKFDVVTKDGLELMLGRRDYVLDQMVDTKALTPAEAADAKKETLKFSGKGTPNGCVQATTNHWGFFCDYFQRWWLEQPTFGETIYDRERALKSGGFRIVTTLDPKVQKGAKAAVERNYKTSKSNPFALMVAAIEPGTGKVRALATNRNFKLDDPDKPANGKHTDPRKRAQGQRGSYPNTTNPLMTGGGDILGYQAGSSFKIFTLVAALENGFPLSYTINAPYRVTTSFPVGGPSANCGGKWCPVNAVNGPFMTGTWNMWDGFGRSVNTFFAQLIQRVGPLKAIDAAKRMGIQFRPAEDQRLVKYGASWGSFTLGVSSSTPLDLANAYATLAADGLYCEPTPIESITDLRGKKLSVGAPNCKQNIKKDVAIAAIDAGRCPVGDQSRLGKCTAGTGTSVQNYVKHPVSGKTGTTDGSKSVTLAITTRQLAVAGFLTDPDYAEHRDDNVVQGSRVREAVSQTMRDGMKGLPHKEFAKPSNKMAMGNLVSIPKVECKSVAEAEAILKRAGFTVAIAAEEVESKCAKGEVAKTNPEGKTVKNGAVELVISKGGKNPEPGDSPGPPGQNNNNGILPCPPACLGGGGSDSLRRD